jgi:23S rRNA (adenine2030-N6)-methyltransferase
MNYRHSFHAGNSADVVKHSLLIALVRALQHKPGADADRHPCRLRALRSGRRAGPAHRRGRAGRAARFADADPLLDDYRAAVRGERRGEPQLYPGSPQILAQLLRPQDCLILNEKHPEDVQALRGAMRDTPAAVHQRDAYELWLAMVPPRTPRGVVVVDPPYEQTDERNRITATLAAAQRKGARRHGDLVSAERPRDACAVEGAVAQAGPAQAARCGALAL